MNHSTTAAARWLLLIHQLPPKPDYFRVRIGRLLGRLGAVAIKNSVYVMPATDEAHRGLQEIQREIEAGKGSASICRADFVDGLTDDAVEALFREARAKDYDSLAREARAELRRASGKLSPRRQRAAAVTLGALRSQIANVRKIDFFDADRGRMRSLLDEIDARLRPGEADGPPDQRSGQAPARGHTWITRQGVFVDRIASAWLIRRWIDRDARFEFLTPDQLPTYTPRPNAFRFDLTGAEYTHEQDGCTFETLLRRFAIADPALDQIAEIVHDIDLRDAKYGRVDAPGVERVLAGIAAACASDEARLERGRQVFDHLYAVFAKEAALAAQLNP